MAGRYSDQNDGFIPLIKLRQIGMGDPKLTPPLDVRLRRRGLFDFNGRIIIDRPCRKGLEEQQKIGLLAEENLCAIAIFRRRCAG